MKAQELRDLLEQGECELLDVREHVEWMRGHIAGARHIPLGELAKRCGELPPDRPLVVMCQSGKRGAQAAALLRERGWPEVNELTGGLAAWVGEDLPTEREARAPWALERQVRVAAGTIVLLGLGLSLVWPWAVALSWFVGAGLVFAGLTDWCGMGLLLARAPWNRPRQRACPGDVGPPAQV